MSNGVVVLVRNPSNGRALPIEEDGVVACWDTQRAAEEATKRLPLVRAWETFVVDLDRLEVRPL